MKSLAYLMIVGVLFPLSAPANASDGDNPIKPPENTSPDPWREIGAFDNNKPERVFGIKPREPFSDYSGSNIGKHRSFLLTDEHIVLLTAEWVTLGQTLLDALTKARKAVPIENLDADSTLGRELVKRFNVETLPTLLRVRDGAVVTRLVGPKSVDEIKKWIEDGVAVEAEPYAEKPHRYQHWDLADDPSSPDPTIVDPFQIGVSLAFARQYEIPAYFTRAFRIEQIVAGSPAERAGLEVGDVIVAEGDHKFRSHDPWEPFKYNDEKRNKLAEQIEALSAAPEKGLTYDFFVVDHESGQVFPLPLTSSLFVPLPATKAAEMKKLKRRDELRRRAREMARRGESLDGPAVIRAELQGDVTANGHWYRHWGIDPFGRTESAPDPEYTDPFRIGVSLGPAEPHRIPAYYRGGLKITKVAPGSPADHYEFEVGDILLSWFGHQISSEDPAIVFRYSSPRGELQRKLAEYEKSDGLSSYGMTFDLLDHRTGEIIEITPSFGATAGGNSPKTRVLRRVLERKRIRRESKESTP